MWLNSVKTVFIVGIKGVAMTHLAVILKKMGKMVLGSDTAEEFITDKILIDNNIKYVEGFDPEQIPKNTDLVVYAAAHQGADNPQVVYARHHKIKTITQAKLLGLLESLFDQSIAVCGCHGKTTTASMLVYCLIKLAVKPSYLVGSARFNNYYGGDFQGKKIFVTEADEYGEDPPRDKTAKFLSLFPDFIICTNIDFDHPDVYPDLEHTKSVFSKFFHQAKHQLFLCADDSHLLRISRDLPPTSYKTYGLSNQADFQVSKISTTNQGMKFILKIKGTTKGLNLSGANGLTFSFQIRLFGEKNVINAAGVIGLLLYLGFRPIQIQSAIKNFRGAQRRFETIAEINRITLMDDYAHHPAEIAATIEAARNRFKKRRLILVFQPHTYSRTQIFLQQFAAVLSKADRAFILPIFASAREQVNNSHVDNYRLVDFGNKKRLIAVASRHQLIDQLKTFIQPRDVIFTIGAGDVYKLHDDIIKTVSAVNNQRSK